MGDTFFPIALILYIVTCLTLTSWWVGVFLHFLFFWFGHITCFGELLLTDADAVWTQIWNVLIHLGYILYVPVFEYKITCFRCCLDQEREEMLEQTRLQFSDYSKPILCHPKLWLFNQLTQKQEINRDICVWWNLWLSFNAALLGKSLTNTIDK